MLKHVKIEERVEVTSPLPFLADLPHSPLRATGNGLAQNSLEILLDVRHRRRFHRSGWK